MTSVRLDRVLMSSLFESFKNYDEFTFSITISGSIPTNGKAFTNSVSYSRAGTIADIYYTKSGSTTQRLVSNLALVVDYAGGTNANIAVRYSATAITVEIFVNNFGAPYTPTSETYSFTVKVFDAPIAS